MVHTQFFEPDRSQNFGDWTAELDAATSRFLGGTDGKVCYLSDVEDIMANRNSMFWAAFWAGLAAPASVYAAPVTYYAYMGNYSLPLNFAQVGMALSHAYAQVVNDGQTTAAIKAGSTSGADA